LVSAIVPARNEEASIARAVESIAAQPEVGEVIVVNDQSADRTGEILAELAARVPKLRILATDNLPTCWTGKNYALSIGAAAATGEWLLFTDADTYHLPGSTARALKDAAEHEAALVSYSPEQETITFWEKALIPRVYWMLSQRYSFENVNNPAKADAAANGQFVLIRRGSYSAIGGQAPIAGEILEDVALARRVKQSGRRLYFASGSGIVRTRMYRSFGAMWQGWTKNLYPLVRASKPSVLLQLITLVVVLGSLLLLSGSIDWAILLSVACFLVVRVFQYGAFLRRNLLPVSYVKYYVPGTCLYWAALIASWWKSTHGKVVWKGRTYTAKAESRT
jgi:glycosyltransferase involved in cell wall biosynthesis